MKTRSKKLAVLGPGLAFALATFGAQAASAVTDVRDVDLAARRPHVMSILALDNDSGNGTTVGTVPAGYRFIIEFVSAFCIGTEFGEQVPTYLRITARGDHYVGPTSVKDGDRAVFSQMTWIYADPKSSVRVFVAPVESTPTISCDVTLSGHLVVF